MLFIIVLIISAVSLWPNGTARQLPDYIKVCKANDPNLSACWKKTFESLRPYMTKDLPEINLPRIDPLKLTEVNLIQDTATRNLFINASLYNVEFSGGQNFQLLDNIVTLDPYFTQLHLLFPKFTLKSKYKARGRILLFDFEGDGDATGEFNDDLTVAQAVQFVSAGYESSGSTSFFVLYELALHNDVQRRLRSEIFRVCQKHGGLTFDAVKEMTYLDMILAEVLRRYPILPFLDRLAQSDYKIPNTDITIQKGTPVYIPLLGLHFDPQYFPNPKKFDPERFTPEKKATMSKAHYLPFGEGPRSCIANLDFNANLTGTPYMKKGKKYVSMTTDSVDIKIEGISIHLDNLLRGNPEISENINKAINENIDLLYQDFLPVVKKTLETVVTEFTNRFLATFPIDVLYPKN